jgi:uncharacterized damage-inducible protein DinB
MKEAVDKFVKIWRAFNEPIVEAAEAMPEEKFSFRPENALEIKSFNELLVHVVSGQNWFLRGITTGNWEHSGGLSASDYPDKGSVVNLLKTNIRETEKKIRAIPEDDLKGEVDSPFGKGFNRMDLLWFMQKHEVYHSGQIMSFMRLAGVKPPMFLKR